MTPDGLHRALIDLGWIALTQRVLGGRPAEAYALRHMMRAAGRPVTFRQLSDAYQELGRGSAYNAKPRLNGLPASDDAIRKRIERIRSGLDDLGCTGAIRTLNGQKAYLIEPRDVARIEAAILFGCGVEIAEAA